MLGGFTMTRLPVVEHLSPEEIDRRYRSCPDAAQKSRWHVLWLVTRPDRPLSATKAAGLVGFTPAWGRAILKRYNAHGPAALTDGRRENGADPKLTAEQRAELFAALRAEPPDHGLWSGPKVAAFVKDRFGVAVCPQTGWLWLKALGFRLVVPRPRHPKAATPEQQRVWL
jgi:transposase